MPYQLWFQFNSEKKEQFQNVNKPLIDFLKSRLPKLIPIIGETIRFQLVDTSKTQDIKEAEAKGIKSLPTLITGSTPVVGLSKIEAFLDDVIDNKKSQATARSSNKSQTRAPAASRNIGGSDEIEEMWRKEIVENSDDDEAGDGESDINARLERATAMTQNRKQITERYQGGGGRGKSKKSTVPPPSASKKQSKRPSRSQPQQQQQDDNDDDPGNNSNRNQNQQPRNIQAPTPARTRNRRGNIEPSPAEISRHLPPADGDSRKDDDLMSKFWDNNTESSY